VSSTLAVARRSSGSQHASLAEQLADTLRTLHGTLQEKDRLRAALDEALASCASSLVAREVAEASLQKQLLGIASLGEATIDKQLIGLAPPLASPLSQPPSGSIASPPSRLSRLAAREASPTA